MIFDKESFSSANEVSWKLRLTVFVDRIKNISYYKNQHDTSSWIYASSTDKTSI